MIPIRQLKEHTGPRPRSLRISSVHTFATVTREPGFLFSGEARPVTELVFLESGSLHSVADGRDILLLPGDLAVYGPNQWHMQYADIGVVARYTTIVFSLEGAELAPLLNRRITASQGVLQLLQQMHREQQQSEIYADDMIRSQLSMLMMILLRQECTGAAGTASHGENEILRRAQQYVAEHIREKLSVPVLARQADVSPSYLTALFQKNLHISPGEYIRRVKLQESKHMIREGSRNFTEIAEILQYSTVHHFSRQFKEKFGITPSEYARSVR